MFFRNSSTVSDSSLFQENPTQFWNAKLNLAATASASTTAVCSGPIHSKCRCDSNAYSGDGDDADDELNSVDHTSEKKKMENEKDGEGDNEGSVWGPPDVVLTFDGYLTPSLLAALASQHMVEVRICERIYERI